MLPESLTEQLGLEGPLEHLEEALTHASFANEQRLGARIDNQRLEFLGDAVLGLCVSELLARSFPSAREGELSLMRSSVVSAEALAEWARAVGLGAALRLGRGADAAGDRNQTNVLADAVEALAGAVYLDRGIEAAQRLAALVAAEPLSRLSAAPELHRDAKSALQERVQAAGGPSPRYRVIDAEGAEHAREFVVVVEVAGVTLATGRGRSKKLAEQAAARAALDGGESPGEDDALEERKDEPPLEEEADTEDEP